jgi:hypothetical protein
MPAKKSELSVKTDTPAAKPATKLTDEQIDEYNRVVAQAELVSIDLAHCEFNVSDDYFAVRHACQDGGEAPAFSYHNSIGEEHLDEEAGLASGKFDWFLSVSAQDAPLLKINAAFVVSYRNLQECRPEAVALFLRKVGRFASFPYFRSLVANLSWMSNANLPTLPVLREIKKK